MKQELIKLNTPELSQLEPSKAATVRHIFEPMAIMLESFEEQYNSIVKEEITEELTSKAKKLRLAIGKVRINTEKVRKEQKEEFLRAGKAIDGVSNILKWAILEKENKLKEIETYHERLKVEELKALQKERVELISPFIPDLNESGYFADMAEDVFQAYLEAKKRDYFEKIKAEVEASERLIEKEKAEAEERERIKKENEQLKKEAIEREKKAKIEADRRAKKEAVEAKRQRIIDKERVIRERAEREAYETKLRIEREKTAKKEAQMAAQRAKLEAELKAKNEAEKKVKQNEELRIEAELNKSDGDKMNDLINDLEVLKTKYSFKSKINKLILKSVQEQLNNIVDNVNKLKEKVK